MTWKIRSSVTVIDHLTARLTIGLMRRCICLEAQTCYPRTGFEAGPPDPTRVSKAVYTESSVESDVLAADAA
jgi:hypothetical protein